jgi:hypothetical protein
MDLGFSPYWGDEARKARTRALPVGCIAPRKINKKNPVVAVPASLRELKEMMPRQWSDIFPKIDDDPFRDQIGDDLRAYYEEKTRALHQGLRDWSGELEQRKQIYNSSVPVSPPRKKDVKEKRSPKSKLKMTDKETPAATPLSAAAAVSLESKIPLETRNSITWGPLYEEKSPVPIVPSSPALETNHKITEEQDTSADLDDAQSDPDEEQDLAPYMEATFVLKWFNQDVVNMLCSQLASGERSAELKMKRRRSSMLPPSRISRRGTSVLRIHPKSGGLSDVSTVHEEGSEAPRIDPELFTPERRTIRSPSRLGAASGGAIYGLATPSSRASLVDINSPVKYWG